MTYSVMTTQYWRFDAAVLREAFRAVEGLTDRDADFAARNYEGTVAAGLGLECAFGLMAALKARGVSARVVDEESLPALPDPFRVKRVSLSPEGLTAAGLLGPARTIGWDHIIVLCLAGLSRTRVAAGVGSVDTGLDKDPEGRTGTFADGLSKPGKTTVTWTLEVYTDDGQRWTMESGDVLLNDPTVQGLGSREDRFEGLTRAILTNAGGAAANSRLEQLREGRFAQLRPYVNRVAHEREVGWLLWFMRGCPGFDL